jgi:hypothetical protein
MNCGECDADRDQELKCVWCGRLFEFEICEQRFFAGDGCSARTLFVAGAESTALRVAVSEDNADKGRQLRP